VTHPKNIVVELDGKKLVGKEQFHNTFAETFGFPDFYGRNMDAWIDCMSSLDFPEDGMTSIHVARGKVLTLKVSNYKYLKKAGESEWLDLLECSAFVNYRRTTPGLNPLIALAFFE